MNTGWCLDDSTTYGFRSYPCNGSDYQRWYQPATLDPSGPFASTDITAVGSDTMVPVGKDMATAYNGQSPAPASRLDSWDSTGPTPVGVKPGCSTPRSNGTNEGIYNMQHDTANPPCIDIVRSSRPPNRASGSTDGGLWFIPYAQDTVRYALSAAVSSYGVDGLTAAQLQGIYMCTIIDWNTLNPAIPARSYINPILPQAGSGLRDAFLSTIGMTGTNRVGSCVTTGQQQNDALMIQNDRYAIAPFSTARFTHPVDQTGVIRLNTTGFAATTPIYLVVRGVGGSVPANVQPLVGDGAFNGGWICSAAGQAIATQNGFTALPNDYMTHTCGWAE